MSKDLFEGVIGHEAAKRILRLACERPHSAYLLTGPDGVGIGMIAEKFVRALAGDHPTELPLTAHPDIAILVRDPATEEKGAKSTVGIETVRAFRERMARRPVVAKRMVGFAPEADRLNEAGMNALLKSMEEPSADAVFVLAARDESRIPGTVKSRTAKLTFGTVPSAAIASWLDASGIGTAAERAQAVDIAEGRPGRALAWLTHPETRAAYQESSHVVERLLQASSAGEAFEILEPVAKRCEASDDSLEAWRETMGGWHAALRHAFAANPTRALHLGHVFMLAARRLGGPIAPRVWLELGLVRMISGERPRFPTHLPVSLLGF